MIVYSDILTPDEWQMAGVAPMEFVDITDADIAGCAGWAGADSDWLDVDPVVRNEVHRLAVSAGAIEIGIYDLSGVDEEGNVVDYWG